MTAVQLSSPLCYWTPAIRVAGVHFIESVRWKCRTLVGAQGGAGVLRPC